MASSSLAVPAAKESGGLDLPFVNSPPDDLICPICLFVHREPVLTSCCGNHFCFSCVEQVRAEQRPCPLCGATGFTIMLDKSFVRKVNELEVVCEHKEKGCPWKGPVNSLKRHLDQVKGDCQFAKIVCPNLCGAVIVHSEFKSHQYVCPKRPYECKFCGFNGVYEEMSAKHWKVCKKYPLPCPNECGEAGIERSQLKKHLEEKCPLHMKSCEFEYAGCTKRLSANKVSEHMASSLQHHLSLLAKHCRQMTESFSSNFHSKIKEEMQANDSRVNLLRADLKVSREDVSRLQSKVESLEDEIDDLKLDNSRLKSIVFVPPFEFIMLEFKKHKENHQQWLSPPFYTHFGGYKMCMGIDAIGSEEGHKTHVSVYANMMKGDYDDFLKWPFKGCVFIELCNQKDTQGNLEEQIMFTYDASEIASRVTGGDIAEHGLGIPTFIKHAMLGFHTTTKKGIEIQYLKNNCLKFRITKVDLMNQRRSTGNFSVGK